MTYNPFEKELEELNETDVENLIQRKIGESWYIEFKRDMPILKSGKIDNLKISKSISSFANTKGGWIFWGIESDSKNNPIELRGIDISQFENFEDQISQILNSNISPKPFYHFKKIPLQNDKFIFIIKVEESPTPPYITSQGVIYQRENNESKPIKDRYIIEKLNEKTEKYYEAIERFSTFDLGETKGQSESNQTFLELYLFPLPFNHFQFKDFYRAEFFRKIAKRFYENVEFTIELEKEESVTVPLNINFNSIYSSEGSLIVRPLTDKNLIYKSTTAELFRNGGLKFLIPLYEFDSKSIPDNYQDSKCLEYILNKFTPHETKDVLELGLPFNSPPRRTERTVRNNSDFENHIKFIDGLELILTILIITNKYKSILEDSKFDFENKIGFRAKITDCWRKFIFFDSDEYLEKLKLYNIPLVPKSDIEIPEFKSRNGYSVDLSKEYSSFLIARFILEGIGLPEAESLNFNDIIISAFKKVQKK